MKKLPVKTITLLIIGALAAGAVVLMLKNTSRPAPDKNLDAPKPALSVTIARPEMRRLPLLLTANGNVSAWQEAIIGSESNGLVLREVRVNVGDTVRRGEVLAVFASEAVNADLAAANAALAEAQANAAEASANAARARTLHSAGMLSAQQLTQSVTTEQTANARIAAARAGVAAQQLRLTFTVVRAPDAGVISARTATLGAVLPAGAELFRMIRQGRLEWRAEVTSAELSRLKPSVRVLVQAASGSELVGTVRMLAPTVDPHTRTALVYVDLAAPAGANTPFKAGMFATGTFELGSSDAITVPQQTVVVKDGFSYVFVLGANGRVRQQKVQAGRRMDARIEIVSGISADAQLVASGAGFLNDGDLVRTIATAAANAGAATAAASK